MYSRTMTDKQKAKLAQLEDARGVPRGTLPVRGVSREGYVFTEVDGVTVILTLKSYNLRGGYKVPSVRTYTETVAPTNLDAAVNANKLFEGQTPDPDRNTGHLGPIVDPSNWKCGSRSCRCNSESYEQRLIRGIGPVSLAVKR